MGGIRMVHVEAGYDTDGCAVPFRGTGCSWQWSRLATAQGKSTVPWRWRCRFGGARVHRRAVQALIPGMHHGRPVPTDASRPGARGL
jgi:hypothetical protein